MLTLAQKRSGTPLLDHDPRRIARVFEEFIEATPSNFAPRVAGSGATASATNVFPSDVVGHFGVHYAALGTSAGTGNQTGWQALGGLDISAGDIHFEALFKIKTALADATNDYQILCGLTDGLFDAGSTDGAYFYYTKDNANWITKTRANATATTTTTSSAAANDTWVRLGIVCAKDRSSVKFTINGAIVATHTTNIPRVPAAGINAMNPYLVMIRLAGTTDRRFVVDYIDCYQLFTTWRQ